MSSDLAIYIRICSLEMEFYFEIAPIKLLASISSILFLELPEYVDYIECAFFLPIFQVRGIEN
jgi:hypothetical protein